jgi:hypothetical protein
MAQDHMVARVLMVGLGGTAALWGALVFFPFWQQSSLDRIANHIIEGDPFKVEALTGLIPSLETAEQANYCRPAARRSAAIIRLRILEDMISNAERQLIDDSLNALANAVRQSITCAPTDSFLWLILFWVESTQNGFRPHYLEYLRLSYQLGPNEGWIGLKRNRMALSIFDQLPPDIAEMAINEFAALLNTGFYGEMVSIFIGPGWRSREQLLARLKGVAERHRQAFAKALYREGYDVDVPGVQRPEPRPWH